MATIVNDFVRRITDLERRVARLRAGEAMWGVLPFVPYIAALPQPFSVTASFVFITCQPGIAVSLMKWAVTTMVNTTNDGSNYWTFVLRNTAGSTIASFTTAADTAGVWTGHEVTSGWTNPVAATNKMFYIKIDKTGSPGSIYIVPSLWVRNGS